VVVKHAGAQQIFERGVPLDICDIKLGRIPCRGLVPSQGTPFLLSCRRGREAIDEQVDQPRAEFMVDGKPPFECQRWGRGGSHTMSCPELVDSRGSQLTRFSMNDRGHHGLTRNTSLNLPIWISSPLSSTAQCTGSPLT
jgi:hypothetical protein